MVDRELLDMMVCSSCKQKLNLEEPLPGDDAEGRLVCSSCGLRYAIREGIPNMLIDEADPPTKSPKR